MVFIASFREIVTSLVQPLVKEERMSSNGNSFSLTPLYIKDELCMRRKCACNCDS